MIRFYLFNLVILTSYVTHGSTIFFSSDSNGTINPSGSFVLLSNSQINLSVTPNANYIPDDITINNSYSIGPVLSQTIIFYDDTHDVIVDARFKLAATEVYTISIQSATGITTIPKGLMYANKGDTISIIAYFYNDIMLYNYNLLRIETNISNIDMSRTTIKHPLIPEYSIDPITGHYVQQYIFILKINNIYDNQFIKLYPYLNIHHNTRNTTYTYCEINNYRCYSNYFGKYFVLIIFLCLWKFACKREPV